MNGLESPRGRARLVIVALGAGILVASWTFIPGLAGAGVLYVLFAPLHARLSRFMQPRPAAALVVVAVVAGVIVPAMTFLSVVLGQAPDVLDHLVDQASLGRLADVHLGTLNLGDIVAGAGNDLRAALPRQALDLFGNIVHTTLNITLALFGLHFLLLSHDRAWSVAKDYLPFSSANADALRVRFGRVTKAMLIGVALTAFLQGAVVGFAFSLVGLPDGLFWGAVTACVSILPIFGSALVWGPGVISLAASGRFNAAIILFVIGAVIASNIDNVTRPAVFWKVSHLHPLTTLLGAFAGVSVFGLSGVLIGPLGLSYLFELLAMYRAEYPAGA